MAAMARGMGEVPIGDGFNFITWAIYFIFFIYIYLLRITYS